MELELDSEIFRIGKKIVAAGLTSSRFGNISIQTNDKILITRTGSMLDELDESQVILVDLHGPCAEDALASAETCVHRAIYGSTNAQAIIHTHSTYAVALSLLEDEVVRPIDSEGMLFLGEMPVVRGGVGTAELAMKASDALVSHHACIVQGHGVFAAARSLKEAYAVACMAEHSSAVKYLVGIWQMRSGEK